MVSCLLINHCWNQTLIWVPETTEGMDKMFNLQYYSRMRFAIQILPCLNEAAGRGELTRVVSVLGAGKEGKIFEDDFLLRKHYSLKNCAGQAICMTSLAFNKLASANPAVSFIHTSPGVVRGTNIMTGMDRIKPTYSTTSLCANLQV